MPKLAWKVAKTHSQTVVTKNHPWLLKKAFEQSGIKVQFPAEPFNFDYQMIQKRFKPPPSNYAYH
jgi:hypothetical protein